MALQIKPHDPLNRTQQNLVLGLLPFVRYVALRVKHNKPKSILLEDLEGYGMIGLCEAAQRFDPSRGLKFITFAYLRVRGAMFDGMLKMSGLAYGQRLHEEPRPIVSMFTEDCAGLCPTDCGASAMELEDRLFLREVLTLISPPTLALIEQIYGADSLMEVAEAQGVSKSWIHTLRNRAIERCREVA